jgi:hypothetical protein
MNPPRDFCHASFRGQIGIARTDITPPTGIYARNWGAAKTDVATAIHRPLTLSALTLRSPSTPEPLVYVDADLGWWKTPELYERFSARLLEALSLEPANLIFALSHTHSAPPLMIVEEGTAGGDLLNTWLESVFHAAVRTVEHALASPSDATLDWNPGRCALATVRDLADPDPANARVICGYNPNGEPDDYLLLGRVTDHTGRLLATLTHYACHPTTLAWENTSISPDYVGAMRETLQENTGAPAMFMLGACGELAPRYQYVGDTAVADAHGRELAFAALSTLQGMEPAGARLVFDNTVESGAPLAVWRRESRELSGELAATMILVDLPLKDWPSAESLEQQRSVATDRSVEERLRRRRDIRRSLGDGSTFGLPVYVWRIGDAVLVGSCCEAYSRLQRNLRERFPDQTIVCMNLINGSIGYLPPAELYDTDVYQVWQTPFDRGAHERVLAAMTEAISNVIAH